MAPKSSPPNPSPKRTDSAPPNPEPRTYNSELGTQTPNSELRTPNCFTVEKHIAPNLKIQQPPDPVRGIDQAAAMALQQAVDLARMHVRRQQTIRCLQRREQRVGSRISKPLPQWRRKAHLLAVNDIVRKQVLDGFLQHVLLSRAPNLQTIRHAHREFDELVIEKRHAALDGTGHAHLVLLHEKLDEVGLLIRVQHAWDGGRLRPGVPVAHVIGIDAVGGRLEQPLLLGLRKRAIEIVEEQPFDAVVAAD